MLAFIQNLGISELLIILFIILLLFGSTKIPSLARSLGKGLSEFKKGLAEGKEDGAPGAKDDHDADRLGGGKSS
ncbi:MAG: twin-arginine translocase TatA/TatE family subunit [Planctomycetes bacterium]|nr:twin-arginine translocase TatA/TatE family subunit [Planctomycetota bacterium]